MSADVLDTVRAEVNPFVGPQSLGRGTRIYGRDKEIRELSRQLLSQRFVVLHSPSGAGKSSLIYADAGLVPKLKEKGFEVYSVPRFSFDVREPGQVTNRYVFALLQALESDLYGQLAIAPERLAEFELRDYFEQRGPKKADHPKCVFLLDQFEEIFTTDVIDLKAKEDFFRQLGEAFRNRENYWALFSLRKEYLAELDIYSHWLPTHLRTKFALTLLDRNAAAEAIQKTSQSTEENYIDSDAAKALAKDLSMMRDIASQDPVSGPFVEPVYLQIVCHSLWEEFRDQGGVLRERMAGIKDVDSVLEEYYATSVAQSANGSKSREAEIRQLFEQTLITEGNTRGQLDFESAESRGVDSQALDVLEKAYLIRRESRLAGRWLELSHDRLIGPIRKSNKAWFRDNRSPLEDRAELWESSGQSNAHLLSAKDIDLPEFASDTTEIPLSELAKEFYLRSQKADKTRRDKDIRRRRTKRNAILALIALIVFIGVSGNQWIKQAEKERQWLAQSWMDRGFSDRDWSSGGNSVNAVHDFALAAKKFDELNNPELARDAQLAAEFILDNGLPYVTFDKLEGEGVEDGAFSADGKRLLTWGNGFVRIRNAESGRPISEKMNHEKVAFARYSDDEQRVLSLGGDRAIIWNAETGERLGDPMLHTDGPIVLGGSFSSDGAQLMTWSENKLFLWDVSKDGQTKLSKSPMPIQGQVLNAKKMLDSNWFTLTSIQAETPLLRIQTLNEKGLISVTDITPELAKFTYAGNYLLTWGKDGQIQLLGIDGERKGKINTEGVQAATLSNDGKRILIRDSNGYVLLWEWDNDKETLTFRAPIDSTGEYQGAAISTNGEQILFWHQGKESQLWYGPDKNIFNLAGLNSVSYAELSGNGTRAFVWDDSEVPRLWNLSKVKFTLEQIEQKFPIIAVSGNGERFLTIKDKGLLQLQHMNKALELKPLADLPVLGQLKEANFSADGNRLVTWYIDGLVQLWNGEDGIPITDDPQEIRDEKGKLHDINVVQFSDDGQQFTITFTDGSVAYLDGNDGSVKEWYLNAQESQVPQNAIAPGGGRVLNWTADKEATLWDVSNDKKFPIGYKGKDIIGATFSGDGDTLLVWGKAGELRLHDGKTGEEIGITLDNISENLQTAALNDDGSRILTLDSNNVVKLWRATDGRMLLPPLNVRASNFSDSSTYGSSIPRVAFVDDNKRILVFVENTVYTYLLEERQDIDGLVRKVELLTGFKIDEDTNKLVELTDTDLENLCGHEQGEPEIPYSNEQRQHISIICNE